MRSVTVKTIYQIVRKKCLQRSTAVNTNFLVSTIVVTTISAVQHAAAY